MSEDDAGVDRSRAEAVAGLPDRIAFLGFGLIGGSIALALRDAGYVGRLVAWSPTGRGPATGSARGFLDRVAEDVPTALDGAGLVVVAGPPLAAIELVRAVGGAHRDQLESDAVVTDVVSTKGAIVEAANEADLRFVGGHPMAGREATGAESSLPDLFLDRPWVVVPGAAASAADATLVETLARSVGARPTRMSAADHDAAVAAISHLPLVLSAALVESVALGPTSHGWPVARGLAASGWRDMTRLANGDPEMGAGIVATNAGPVGDRLVALRHVLDDWIEQISADRPDADVLRARLHRAREALRGEAPS